MRKIYQVMGDIGKYQITNYIVEDKEYNYLKISSEALLKHYNYDKMVLVCPISINKRDDEIRKSFHNTPEDKIEILRVHAIGRYNNKEYISKPVNISLQLFTYMLSNSDEIILDVSTGHNIYNLALIEAGRFFSTFNSLKDKIMCNNNNKEYAKIAICEPVTSESMNTPKKIYVEPLRTHAFFSLPINRRDNFKISNYIDKRELPAEIKRRIDEETRKINREINDILDKAIIAYNAIRYNTPLVFSILELDNEERIFQLIKQLNNFCNKVLKVKEDNNKIYSMNIERTIYELYLSLIIYYSIIKNIKIIKAKSFNNKIETLDDLKNFIDLYKLLGLDINSRFLNRDLNEIEYRKDSIIDCITLNDLLYNYSNRSKDVSA